MNASHATVLRRSPSSMLSRDAIDPVAGFGEFPLGDRSQRTRGASRHRGRSAPGRASRLRPVPARASQYATTPGANHRNAPTVTASVGPEKPWTVSAMKAASTATR